MPHDILASSRRKRRKKSFIKAIFLVAGIFVLIGGLVGFFYVPEFRINEITISGIKVADESELKGKIESFLKGKILKILPVDNVLLLPKAKIIVSLLQDFPILKKIDIDRNFFQRISVLVEERKPAALLCQEEGKCVFIDEIGFIFQEAPSFSGGIFVKFIASSTEETISENELEKLLSFEKLLSENKTEILKIVLKGSGEYEVYLKEGWKILLNSKNEPTQSFNNLILVLDTKIKEKRPKLEYIDLRFDNKVFFKYK